jgi:hypothetical protein
MGTNDAKLMKSMDPVPIRGRKSGRITAILDKSPLSESSGLPSGFSSAWVFLFHCPETGFENMWRWGTPRQAVGLHPDGFIGATRYTSRPRPVRPHLSTEDELITAAVNVQDFDRRIFDQVLPELGNEDIHAPGVEDGIAAPNKLEGQAPFQHVVGMETEQTQEFGFLGCQFPALVLDAQGLFLIIERVQAQTEFSVLARIFSPRLASPEDRSHAEDKLLETEGLRDIIVSADSEAFDPIFLERPGGEEYHRNVRMDPTDVAAESESILLGKHDVDQTEVEDIIEEDTERFLSITAKSHIESLRAERFLKEEAEVVVVLDQENPGKERYRTALFPGHHHHLSIFISILLI